MSFNEVVYIDSPYRPEAGSFAKPNNFDGERYKVVQWYYCRDLFHSRLYNCKLFFFTHQTSKGRNIAEFMHKIESILGLKSVSEYGPTQRKAVMWIKPSRWWTVKPMRRSLFTILLRAGNNYFHTKDNFQDALFSDPYSFGTRYAIERFMAGYTMYTGKKRGWYKQFHDEKLTKEMIDLLLISSD